MICSVLFPPTWVDSLKLDEALIESGGPHSCHFSSVTFKVPIGCKIMVDAAVKILSLVNQLKYSNKHVSLIFEEATNGTMGYLSRVGFFDYLEGTVEVLPFKPSTSRADTFRGKNSDLIELVDISSSDFDRNIVLRLSNDLLDKVNVDNPNAFKTATYTFLSELIGNVSRHGRSDLNGYMALQTYRSSNRITIAVS